MITWTVRFSSRLKSTFCLVQNFSVQAKNQSRLSKPLYARSQAFLSSQSGYVIKSRYPPVELPTEPFHDTVLKAIKQQVDHGKNKIAFINGDTNEQISYKQIYDASLGLAEFLHQKGFGKDVLCAVMPNMWQYAVCLVGASKAGGCVSGASAHFTDFELQRQFNDSGSKVVVTVEALLPKVLKAVEQSPTVKHVLVIPSSPDFAVPSNVTNFNDAIATKPNPSTVFPSINIQEDLFMLPYSSGTTGAPKGVMLSHFNVSTMLKIYVNHDMEHNYKTLDPNWDNEKETLLLFLPFYHVFGFGLLAASLLKGSPSVVLSHFEPNNFCTAVQNNKIRMLPLVPPILTFLAKHPICDNYDLSSVQYIICGAAPAGKEIGDEIMRKYKNAKYIQQGYGMTECTMGCHIPDLKQGQPFGSVGHLLSNYEMRLIDPTTEKDVERGERGEICLRGPTIMKGYLHRPHATAETIIDGWLHTGDIGYVDDNDNLFIVDRLKELIKVKGLQVAPAELEDLLLSHPRIRDAAIVPVPCERAGELPRAYVVRADDQLTEKEVQGFVKEKVSAHKELAGGVEFIKEIPKSAAGKILRRVLKERANAKA